MLLQDPTDFGELRLPDGRLVRFYQLFPLYEEERLLKIQKGTAALFELFEKNGIDEVIRPDRPNVAAL